MDVPQRLRWAAGVEAATTVSQLALALRTLDAAVRQEALKKPYGEKNNLYLEATVTKEGAAGKGEEAGKEYMVLFPRKVQGGWG